MNPRLQKALAEEEQAIAVRAAIEADLQVREGDEAFIAAKKMFDDGWRMQDIACSGVCHLWHTDKKNRIGQWEISRPNARECLGLEACADLLPAEDHAYLERIGRHLINLTTEAKLKRWSAFH